MKMCQGFSENGHSITLYARKGIEKDNIFLSYGIRKTFNLEYCDYPSIPLLNHLYFSHQVKKRIITNKYQDILYGRHIYSLYAVRNIGSPIIFEAHAPPANPLQKHLEKELFSHSNFKSLIVISDALRSEYIHLYPNLDRKSVRTLHDAADPLENSTLDLVATWPGRHHALQVGYIGHLYPGKGMEIITKLAKLMPNTDFHVIGGTDNDITYWKKACKNRNLYFHGFIDHGKLTAYYQNLDVLLAPYQSQVQPSGRSGDISKWMSPLKLFEYMAAQKAIVCSDLPVLREILHDKVTGLFVKADDTNAWRQALTTLRKHPELRNLLGKNAFEQFQNHHTWRKRAAQALL